MSFKRWLALLLFYISYLFFGASIYYVIENYEETEQRAIELKEREIISAYITKNLIGDDRTKYEILVNITEYCGKKVIPYDAEEIADPLRWTFYHAFFFAFTVCSTVGYGNLSPSTTLGRMVLIAYSLIGMPINTILFAGLGEYFGSLFRDIYRKYKNYKMSNNDLYIPKQFGLVATIVMALIPGIFFFIILPSCIFSYFEGWPFSLSIYYSYVTTTTIGFGDYVPTFQPHQPNYFGVWFIVYQIFVIVWFIFSLGYLLMIMGFITNGLRSKKLRYLEKQLKSNIKNTQHRIWHGVIKDVGYLRKLINEVYINVKPIYNEVGTAAPYDIYRSNSCPELSMYKSVTPIFKRKRAYSESYSKYMKDSQMHGGHVTPVHRASSDTDLDKINKEKTFENVNTFRETTNLLAKVVTALGDIQAPQYDSGPDQSSLNSSSFGAYHGLTDSQILSDEISVSAQNKFVTRQRERSSSDFFINDKKLPIKQHNEWTWCGDNSQIQQEINDRVRFSKTNNLAKAALYKTALNNSVILNVDTKNEMSTPKKLKTRKFSTDFVFDLFRRRSSAQTSGKNNSNSTTDVVNIENVPELNGIRQEKYDSLRNTYSTANNSNNSSLKSEKKDGLLSFNNVSSEGIPSSLDQNRPDINQLKKFNQRKGSLYPFFHNNMLNETTKDYGNFQKGIPQRNSIFSKKDRSGSLAFPTDSNRIRTSSLSTDYRKSIDSLSSNKKNEDVLENTSIADLIRALEILHTRAATQNEPINQQQQTIEEEIEDDQNKKKRKNGTTTAPQISPIFSLFSKNNTEDNKDKFDENLPLPAMKNLLGNTRRSSLLLETGQFNKRDQQPTDVNKYGRRFSVRPVDLQTPPGLTSFPSALQRRLSLRLSKDFHRTGNPMYAASSSLGASAANSSGGSGNSSIRSSIRKPITRLAQITQPSSTINITPSPSKNSEC